MPTFQYTADEGMDKESFIEWMREVAPDMAAMVDEGFCSWEDIGFESGDDETDAAVPRRCSRSATAASTLRHSSLSS